MADDQKATLGLTQGESNDEKEIKDQMAARYQERMSMGYPTPSHDVTPPEAECSSDKTCLQKNSEDFPEIKFSSFSHTQVKHQGSGVKKFTLSPTKVPQDPLAINKMTIGEEPITRTSPVRNKRLTSNECHNHLMKDLIEKFEQNNVVPEPTEEEAKKANDIVVSTKYPPETKLMARDAWSSSTNSARLELDASAKTSSSTSDQTKTSPPKPQHARLLVARSSEVLVKLDKVGPQSSTQAAETEKPPTQAEGMTGKDKPHSPYTLSLEATNSMLASDKVFGTDDSPTDSSQSSSSAVKVPNNEEHAPDGKTLGAYAKICPNVSPMETDSGKRVSTVTTPTRVNLRKLIKRGSPESTVKKSKAAGLKEDSKRGQIKSTGGTLASGVELPFSRVSVKRKVSMASVKSSSVGQTIPKVQKSKFTRKGKLDTQHGSESPTNTRLQSFRVSMRVDQNQPREQYQQQQRQVPKPRPSQRGNRLPAQQLLSATQELPHQHQQLSGLNPANQAVEDRRIARSLVGSMAKKDKTPTATNSKKATSAMERYLIFLKRSTPATSPLSLAAQSKGSSELHPPVGDREASPRRMGRNEQRNTSMLPHDPSHGREEVKSIQPFQRVPTPPMSCRHASLTNSSNSDGKDEPNSTSLEVRCINMHQEDPTHPRNCRRIASPNNSSEGKSDPRRVVPLPDGRMTPTASKPPSAEHQRGKPRIKRNPLKSPATRWSSSATHVKEPKSDKDSPVLWSSELPGRRRRKPATTSPEEKNRKSEESHVNKLLSRYEQARHILKQHKQRTSTPTPDEIIDSRLLSVDEMADTSLLPSHLRHRMGSSTKDTVSSVVSSTNPTLNAPTTFGSTQSNSDDEEDDSSYMSFTDRLKQIKANRLLRMLKDPEYGPECQKSPVEDVIVRLLSNIGDDSTMTVTESEQIFKPVTSLLQRKESAPSSKTEDWPLGRSFPQSSPAKKSPPSAANNQSQTRGKSKDRPKSKPDTSARSEPKEYPKQLAGGVTGTPPHSQTSRHSSPEKSCQMKKAGLGMGESPSLKKKDLVPLMLASRSTTCSSLGNRDSSDTENSIASTGGPSPVWRSPVEPLVGAPTPPSGVAPNTTNQEADPSIAHAGHTIPDESLKKDAPSPVDSQILALMAQQQQQQEQQQPSLSPEAVKFHQPKKRKKLHRVSKSKKGEEADTETRKRRKMKLKKNDEETEGDTNRPMTGIRKEKTDSSIKPIRYLTDCQESRDRVRHRQGTSPTKPKNAADGRKSQLHRRGSTMSSLQGTSPTKLDRRGSAMSSLAGDWGKRSVLDRKGSTMSSVHSRRRHRLKRKVSPVKLEERTAELSRHHGFITSSSSPNINRVAPSHSHGGSRTPTPARSSWLPLRRKDSKSAGDHGRKKRIPRTTPLSREPTERWPIHSAIPVLQDRDELPPGSASPKDHRHMEHLTFYRRCLDDLTNTNKTRNIPVSPSFRKRLETAATQEWTQHEWTQGIDYEDDVSHVSHSTATQTRDIKKPSWLSKTKFPLSTLPTIYLAVWLAMAGIAHLGSRLYACDGQDYDYFCTGDEFECLTESIARHHEMIN